MANVVPNGCDEHRKDVLRTQDAACASRAEAGGRLDLLRGSAPHRLSGFQLEEEVEWRRHPNPNEEEVGCLQDVNSVDVVVVGVGCVVDGSDGEQQAVHLVCRGCQLQVPLHLQLDLPLSRHSSANPSVCKMTSNIRHGTRKRSTWLRRCGRKSHSLKALTRRTRSSYGMGAASVS